MRKTRGGWGATTAPFPKSRASYFRFARFNTSALYYTILYYTILYYTILSESLAKAVPSLFQRAMFKADRGE